MRAFVRKERLDGQWWWIAGCQECGRYVNGSSRWGAALLMAQSHLAWHQTDEVVL